MLNKSGVTKTTYAAPTQILANVDMKVALGCVVAQAVGTVVGDRKIAKAGTPITGNLNAPTTPFTKAATAEVSIGNDTTKIKVTQSNAVGVLLHDVDVTSGAANGAILVFGFVNKNRLASTVKTEITSEVETALAGKVTFLTV